MPRDIIYTTASRISHVQEVDAPVIALRRFETGFYQIHTSLTPEELNNGVVPENVLESAIAASMFGWGSLIAKDAHDWFATTGMSEKLPGPEAS